MLKKLLFACLLLSIGTIYGQDATIQSDPHMPVGDVVNPNPSGEPVPTSPAQLTNDPHNKVDPNASSNSAIVEPNTVPKEDPIPGVDPNAGQVIDPNPVAPHAPEPVTAPAPVH